SRTEIDVARGVQGQQRHADDGAAGLDDVAARRIQRDRLVVAGDGRVDRQPTRGVDGQTTAARAQPDQRGAAGDVDRAAALGIEIGLRRGDRAAAGYRTAGGEKHFGGGTDRAV